MWLYYFSLCIVYKVSHNFNIVCNVSCNCLLVDSDFSQSRVYSYNIIDQEKGSFYMYLGLRKVFSVTVIKLGEEKRWLRLHKKNTFDSNYDVLLRSRISQYVLWNVTDLNSKSALLKEGFPAILSSAVSIMCSLLISELSFFHLQNGDN